MKRNSFSSAAALLALLSLCSILLVNSQTAPASCCSPRVFPRCGNTQIENYVCSEFSECCTTKWDAHCAELVHFAFTCPTVCGDGFCVAPTENCASCPQDCGKCDRSDCTAAFNGSRDPLFADQWHLSNYGTQGGTLGNDVHVLPVWQNGIYGTGIKLAIVDTGLQRTHPDIQCNYDASISYDFDLDRPDPEPLFLEEHGTACAGVAAARDNSACGIGAAFRATIGGIRILGGNFADSIAAASLSYKNDEIDIYSNSWGPSDDGATIERFPRTLNAIANAAKNGRKGKGNIFVWAGGNGRHLGDHSNYDELANSPYTIAVGASDYNGVVSMYSESGTNLLVNAPSNNYVLKLNGQYEAISGIVTSDLLGFRGGSTTECSREFSGTSASAPLVAGVIALMLEANRNLSYRDVQHIIVETSEKNDPTHADWSENAAGHHFNSYYGFGRIHAEAAVAAAKTWKPVCPKLIEIKKRVNVNAAIPQSAAEQLLINVDIDDKLVVEHVVITLHATHSARGQIIMGLASPSETVSVLSIGRSRDTQSSFNDFPFSTVQMWGELSNGTWTLSVYDSIRDSRSGVLKYFDISIYGSRLGCVDPKPQPVIDPEYRKRPGSDEEEKPYEPLFDIHIVGPIVLSLSFAGVALLISGFVFFQLCRGDQERYATLQD